MTELQTTHHDFKVTYREDFDEWRCHALDLKAKSLTLLRKKIDKVLSVERRIDNLPVLILGDGWSHFADRVTTATATLFDRKNGVAQGVWVTYTRGNCTERKKMMLSQVWIDTPENRERLQAIIEQRLRVREEQNKLSQMAKAVEAFAITELEVAKLTATQDVDAEFDPPPNGGKKG